MESTCSKCGKRLGLFSAIETIRGVTYCWECSRNVPSCDKCRYHTSYSDHRHGECQYHQQWLRDYDNVCEHYSR